MVWYAYIPFACIFLFLGAAIALAPLRSRRVSLSVTLGAALLAAALSAVLLYALSTDGAHIDFAMGRFSAPLGNELRMGPLQALFSLAFSLVTALSLLGGYADLKEDVPAEKTPLYCTMVNLTLAALFALTYTNDLFTGYVFVEISTMSAVALVMAKEQGPTLTSSVRYLFLSLLGSGLFLLGLVLLYSVTGQLLMPQLGQAVRVLYGTWQYRTALRVLAGLMIVGLGVKSALFPFHRWLPPAHGSATTASSAILSGVVLKGTAVLLISIYYRVFTLDGVRTLHIDDIVFALGVAGMLFGSFAALDERHSKRMLAYSSVAQMGYLFAGVGLGTQAGMAAACFQLLVHAASKPLLFCCVGRLSAVSRHRKNWHDLRGSAYRDPLAGVGFTVGALSMIGIPLLAGFSSKLNLASAGVQTAEKMGATIAVITVSTVCNALYYIPAVTAVWSHGSDGAETPPPAPRDPYFTVSTLCFIALVLLLGVEYDPIDRLIVQGLSLM